MENIEQRTTELKHMLQSNNHYSSNEENKYTNQFQFKEYQQQILSNQTLKTEENEMRKWAEPNQHLPIDTATKYVDTSKKDTKLMYAPKIEFAEKMEMPKYIFPNEHKMAEVPKVNYKERMQNEPYVIEKLKYIPKEVIHYNIIKKPVIKNIVNEKKVNVLQIHEQIKYKTEEMIEDVINHFDPSQNKMMDSDGNTINGDNHSLIDEELEAKFENPRFQNIDDNNTLPALLEPFGQQIQLKPQPTIEKVFVPKVEKVVEIQKHIDIPIDFPVPYIVPKPKIVDVKVPVFKFKDKYVPVPIRKKIIPKIKWSDKKYVVDCVMEKPYLVYHNIVKIVPTDSKIAVREYPKGVNRINPSSLSEQDNLSIWMKVNADLKAEKEEEKKENAEDNASAYSCECSEVGDQEQTSYSDINTSQECVTTRSSNENIVDTLPLHPGHPLAMVHLQNKWIHEKTTKTHNLYDEPYVEAHKNAVFNLSTNYPREAEIETSQIAAIQAQTPKNDFPKRQNDYFVN